MTSRRADDLERKRVVFLVTDPIHLVDTNAMFSHEMHDGEIRLDFFKRPGLRV